MEPTPDGRRPTKVVLAGVALFLLAVVLGRLLVAGGGAWIVFVAALPVALVVVSRFAGWGGAVFVTLLFALAVLAVRWFVQVNPAGWAALLLLPVVAFTGLVVGRVLAKLRQPVEREEVVGADEPGESSPESGE